MFSTITAMQVISPLASCERGQGSILQSLCNVAHDTLTSLVPFAMPVVRVFFQNLICWKGPSILARAAQGYIAMNEFNLLVGELIMENQHVQKQGDCDLTLVVDCNLG